MPYHSFLYIYTKEEAKMIYISLEKIKIATLHFNHFNQNC